MCNTPAWEAGWKWIVLHWPMGLTSKKGRGGSQSKWHFSDFHPPWDNLSISTIYWAIELVLFGKAGKISTVIDLVERQVMEWYALLSFSDALIALICGRSSPSPMP
jgi:hypothetical protein